jgi:hypothetical protein
MALDLDRQPARHKGYGRQAGDESDLDGLPVLKFPLI